MRKGGIYALILVSILMVNTIIVYANDEADKLKDAINQNANNQKKLESKIDESKKEYKSIEEEIKKLDMQMDKVDKEIQALESELKELNSKIETTENQLKEAEDNIKSKTNTLNSRLRVMYKNGTVGYLEVLLSSKDLSDFLTRLDMVERIVDHDVDLLKYMKEQRDIIEEKKATLENQKQIMETAKKKVDIKRRDLLVVSRQKDNYMAQLSKNIKAMEKRYDDFKKEADALQNQYRRLVAGNYTGGKMAWPSPGYTRITSPYGYRIHPIFKTKKMHTGVDLGVPSGSKIVAASDGVVQHADWLGGYGKAVWIDHGGGISTLYAHNSRLLVKEGDTVKRGQTVALSGSTGNSTGPHLHFEVRKDGKYVDPMPWIKGK